MNNLALIDGDYIAYITTSKNKVLDDFGNPKKDVKGNFIYDDSKTLEDVYNAVDLYINNLLDKCTADCYIGFLTWGSFRKNINPDYKANRKYELIKFLNQAKLYIIDKWQFKSYHDHPNLYITENSVVNINTLEADDLVNLYKIYYKDTYNAFICSNDKDLLNLEGTHFSTKHFSWVTTSKEQAEYEFLKDLICGQSGDNIKGIPGKGEKYFNNLYKIKSMSLGDILNIYIENNLTVEYFYKQYTSLKILDDTRIISTYLEPIIFKS